MRIIYTFVIAFLIGINGLAAQSLPGWFVGLEFGGQYTGDPDYRDHTYQLRELLRLDMALRSGYRFSPQFSGGFLLRCAQEGQYFDMISPVWCFVPYSQSLFSKALQLGVFGRFSLPLDRKKRLGLALEAQLSGTVQQSRWYYHDWVDDFVEEPWYKLGLQASVLPFLYYRVNERLQIELNFSELLSWGRLSSSEEQRVPDTQTTGLRKADLSRLSGRIGLRYSL